MDGETASGMIDPDDHQQPTLGGAPDHGVIAHVSSDLRGLEPLWVIQHLAHLGPSDPPLGVIPLQVADVRRVPDHRAAIHRSTEYRQQSSRWPYDPSIHRRRLGAAVE
jgi:hypothetical protein